MRQILVFAGLLSGCRQLVAYLISLGFQTLSTTLVLSHAVHSPLQPGAGLTNLGIFLVNQAAQLLQLTLQLLLARRRFLDLGLMGTDA